MPAELYDTTVFIDYWKGDPAALALIDVVRKGEASASYSPITATELWQYSGLGRREEIEFNALIRYFLTEAPLTTSAAIRAGQWLRAFSRSKRRRLCLDALLAATALERGELVRSRNAKDISLFHSNVQSY